MPALGVLERAFESLRKLFFVPRIGEALGFSRDLLEPKALTAAGDQPQDVLSLNLASQPKDREQCQLDRDRSPQQPHTPRPVRDDSEEPK